MRRGSPVANEKEQIRSYPTPNLADVVFYEYRDSTLPRNQNPEYGVTTPIHGSWPDHKLSFISPANENGIEKWVYVADRENQDLYNFSYTQADIGGTKFDAVSRVYVIPRDGFDPDAHAMGNLMPDVPEGLFPGPYVLAERRQIRSEDQELDSLYVSEMHVYVKRVSISEVKMNDETGRVKRSVTNLYYRGETVSGTAVETLAASPTNAYWGQQADGTFRELDQLSENWFAIIESNVIPDGSVNSAANPARTRIINRVTPLGTDIYFIETGAMPSPVPAYGSAHYDAANWPNHKLSFISPADASGLLFKFHYVADRPTQDEYNFTSAQADIGGRKFDSVERTYLEPRATFVEATVAMGATMPDVPSAAFGTGYVLASEQQSRTGEPQFDNLYVTIERTYVRKVTLGDIGYDEPTGRSNSSTVTLRYSGEVTSGADTIDTLFADKDNAYWGLQTDGTFRTCERLTDNWFAVVTRSVLPESPENGSSNPAKARVQNRVTPLGTDIYFTETGSMPASVPTYGTAHYDAANWPNHKLSLITAADRSGNLFTFHYVADRENQDDYNYELNGDALVRTYVIPRDEYSCILEGEEGSDSTEFTHPQAATLDFRFSKFGFADDTLVRSNDPEIDSRYVIIRRRFIEPVVTEATWSDEFNSYVLITKEIISPENPIEILPAPIGSRIEVRKGNAFHNVRITQAILSADSDSDVFPYVHSVVPGFADFRFPPKLESAGIVFALAAAYHPDAAPSYSEDYYFDWKIVEARPGPYKASVTKIITDDPEAAILDYPLTDIPAPKRETFGIASYWASATPSSNRTSATAKEVLIPATIHDEITIGGSPTIPPDLTGRGTARTATLPETPGYTEFVALTQATIGYQTRQLGLGLYEVNVTTIDITNLYGDE